MRHDIETFIRELKGELPVGKWRPPLDPAKKLDLLVKSKQLGNAAQGLLAELRAIKSRSTKV